MRSSMFSLLALSATLMAPRDKGGAAGASPAPTSGEPPAGTTITQEAPKPLNDEFEVVNKETGEIEFVPEVIRHVTVETLKIGAGETVYVKILEAMKKAKKAVGRSSEPATLLAVRDLKRRKDTQLVVAVALRGIFSEEFENDSYVGRCFAIHKGAEKKGQSEDRKYYSYTVDEIRDPEAPKVAKPAA